MIKKIQIIFTFFLLCGIPSLYALELKETSTNEQLAHFIYQMATAENISVEKLLKGIKNSELLTISDYDKRIPIREIYGTIINERFGDEIGPLFFEHKAHPSREICSFIDKNGLPWRFHITIFEEKQYVLMEQFLKKQIKNDK
jgi:hypothetical protein